MAHLDFIEIGTCDFGAEISRCADTACGISVEPIAEYLDRLPNRPNVRKINAAISDYDGTADLYYVAEDDIQRYGLPFSARGCNRLGAPHPTVVRWLTEMGVNPTIIKRRSVPIMSIATLIGGGVASIEYLKIDTEGHDCVILNCFLDFIADKPQLRPRRIRYESNALTPMPERRAMAARLRACGYSVVSTSRDTTATLNLSSQ